MLTNSTLHIEWSGSPLSQGREAKIKAFRILVLSQVACLRKEAMTSGHSASYLWPDFEPDEYNYDPDNEGFDEAIMRTTFLFSPTGRVEIVVCNTAFELLPPVEKSVPPPQKNYENGEDLPF